MEHFVKGSIENLITDFTDKLNQLSTLDGTNPIFYTYGPTATVVQNGVAAQTQGMSVYCLIDTTLVGYVTGTTYELYIQFTIGSETPLIHAGSFIIDAIV